MAPPRHPTRRTLLHLEQHRSNPPLCKCGAPRRVCPGARQVVPGSVASMQWGRAAGRSRPDEACPSRQCCGGGRSRRCGGSLRLLIGSRQILAPSNLPALSLTHSASDVPGVSIRVPAYVRVHSTPPCNSSGNAVAVGTAVALARACNLFSSALRTTAIKLTTVQAIPPNSQLRQKPGDRRIDDRLRHGVGWDDLQRSQHVHDAIERIRRDPCRRGRIDHLGRGKCEGRSASLGQLDHRFDPGRLASGEG